MNKVFLVTGSAGFIGFHLCKALLQDNYSVIGVDNINNYYDTKLKKDRLSLLNSFSNFKFYKLNIENLKELSRVFEYEKPYKVINLAAQAGVRYSLENPFAYVNSNILGFVNIIEMCRKYNVEGLIYASSSSVYGLNKKTPFSIDDRVSTPISIYASSKRFNELTAHAYSQLYGIHTTGLRFFSVYGPWGRPDMAMFIFTKKIISGESIDVYNYGKMERDFTYIDDIVDGIRKSIKKNYKCEILNLGNNKTEKLQNVITLIEKYLGIKAKINFLPMQPGDIEKSSADIGASSKLLNFMPKTNIDFGLQKFISWYKEYHNVM